MSDPWEIRLVVSDFGGVIASYDYRIFCRRLAQRIGGDAEAIYSALYSGDLHADFERGRLTGPEFWRKVMQGLGSELPYAEFFDLYGDIFAEIPGTAALLSRLARRYPLYLLSNTNEIHFGYVRRTVETLRLFAQCVVSHEVGAMKPEAAIYQEVLRRARLPAAACVFIDDSPGHVEGARRVGLQAIHFRSPEQCAADLVRLGVVIPS
jgi:putative hydrolase of the HAD superfamily